MFHHGHQSSYRNDDDDDDEKGENDYYLPEQFQTCLAITEESEQNRCVRRKKRREEALKTAFRALVTSFKATDKIVRDWGELRITSFYYLSCGLQTRRLFKTNIQGKMAAKSPQ
eukprot:11848628-Ditylum_brightwellii.AAC.1